MEGNKDMEKAFWASFQKAFSKGFTAIEAVFFAFIKVLYVPKKIYYYYVFSANPNDLEKSILDEFHSFYISIFGKQAEVTFRKMLAENKRSNSSIDK